MLKKNKQIILLLLLLSYGFILIRTAWISDDAAITLRTILNFLNGYGPTFNIDERVQAYTHPLWFLALSGSSFLIKNVFYSTFILSIGFSLVTIWLLFFRLSTSIYGAIAAGLCIILSKAYIDFSTSGLENPLSHLLIVTAVLSAINISKSTTFKKLCFFFITCSFLYLSRPDLLILICPLAVLIVINNVKTPNVVIKAFALGLLPVILWTLFSIYYYGFPFPNTAYAKLATGIPFVDRVEQGLQYVIHSAYTDPLTIFCIVLGIVIGLLSGSLGISLSIGVLLYLAYIVSIGGDFMEGRFFTAPLLISVIQISRFSLSSIKFPILIVLIVGLGLININSTVLSDAKYSNLRFTHKGIADERGYYFQHLGLITAKNDTFKTPDWKLVERKVDIACGGLGMKSLSAGPSTHYIDICALADPLLARIPTLSTPLRVGHYERAIPPGYFESVVLNKNLVQDEGLKYLYEGIRKITRGPLNERERFKDIALFNLNKNSKPEFAKYRYRFNLNEEITFKLGTKGSLFLKDFGESTFITSGWAAPEPWGAWSLGNIARLRLAVPSKENPTSLDFDAQVILTPLTNTQTIEVFIVKGESYLNGQATLQQVIELKGDASSSIVPLKVKIPITQQEIGDGFINLEFRFPTPVKPKDLLGVVASQDDRDLTLGLKSAVFK